MSAPRSCEDDQVEQLCADQRAADQRSEPQKCSCTTFTIRHAHPIGPLMLDHAMTANLRDALKAA